MDARPSSTRRKMPSRKDQHLSRRRDQALSALKEKGVAVMNSMATLYCYPISSRSAKTRPQTPKETISESIHTKTTPEPLRKKTTFLDLSNDVLLVIFDQLESLPRCNQNEIYPLKSLFSTNRGLRELSRPLLHSSICLGQRGKPWTGNEWCEAREAMEGLLETGYADDVKKLRVHLKKWNGGWEELANELDLLVKFWRRLPKLRNLTLSLDDKVAVGLAKWWNDFPDSRYLGSVRTLTVHARHQWFVKFCPKITHLGIHNYKDHDACSPTVQDSLYYSWYPTDTRMYFNQLSEHAPNVIHLEATTGWDPPLLSSLAHEYPRLQHLSLIEGRCSHSLVYGFTPMFKEIGVLFPELNSLEVSKLEVMDMSDLPSWVYGYYELLGFDSWQSGYRETMRGLEYKAATTAFREIASLKELWIAGMDTAGADYRVVMRRLPDVSDDEEEEEGTYARWACERSTEQYLREILEGVGSAGRMRWKFERFVERKGDLLGLELSMYP
ncbi:hypothetical protein K458DRAFT_403381 [Lentithecium fluviatile CBS 122367]|uniref:Uncharacterized protein n=1 Tax=Lentithecium fluviatile CBS 122367 TaxID=1168545 RepID=A0A6G1J3Q2_9PLEO|nr:hypothetical protein K458DRAFT_403381 [Lentithecium fluviatile CBS 122367]